MCLFSKTSLETRMTKIFVGEMLIAVSGHGFVSSGTCWYSGYRLCLDAGIVR